MKTKVKTRQPGKRGTFGHYFKAHWQLYMMVAFPVIMLAVFSYAPMYGILLAFKNYRIVDASSVLRRATPTSTPPSSPASIWSSATSPPSAMS